MVAAVDGDGSNARREGAFGAHVERSTFEWNFTKA